uniref:Peptidase M24 domain-containing protein n=1 Tax=Globodera rostochiensis TaxID=31243 RepID=A0A914I8K9_GLORO
MNVKQKKATAPKRDVSSSPSQSSTSDSNNASSESDDITPANDKVLTKYSMAAEVTNAVLKELIAAVKEGVEVGHLCSLGDQRLLELTGNLFKKEKGVQKGISMPTCVSVDNCEGQLVKIDLGAHVDGYIATAAHSVVVGASEENKTTGKKAHAIFAAYNIMEMVLRMLKPAKSFKNFEMTDRIGKLAKIYGTTPVENMLSHQIERFKTNFEVYTIDILISSGEGKVKTHDARTTVFKKADDIVYSLKLKASRSFLYEAQRRFGAMPFSLRQFDDEKTAKVGSTECSKHDLMQPYQVFYEREGEVVAQFKCTAIIMPTGIFKITGLPLDTALVECDVKIQNEEIAALLGETLKPKKKKSNKRGAGEKKPEKEKEATEETKGEATKENVDEK